MTLRRNNSGVTLVELLVSLAIITLVIFSVLKFYSTNLLTNTKEYKRAELYYRAVEEMENLIAKDYSSADLKTYFNSNSNIRFLDDGKYLLKIKVESVDPFTTLAPEPYPTKQSEDRLLKKITISAVALEDAEYPDMARQVDIFRFISP